VLSTLKSLDLLNLPVDFHELPNEELAAIEALRTHPTLRNIGTVEAGLLNTVQSKEDFWKAWDSEWASERALRTALQETRLKFTLNRVRNSTFRLEIKQQKQLDNLSFLIGAPITELSVAGTGVTDLRPLEGLALTTLDIRMTPVTDLHPLQAPILSSSLRKLEICRIPATEFSPIAACKNLEHLDVAETKFADLGVVRGFKLKVARLTRSHVTDIEILSGMPLERVMLNDTGITDIRALLKCPTLKDLVLPAGANDIRALHSLPSLNRLSTKDSDGFSKEAASDFWMKYEHGGLTAEVVPTIAKESAASPEDSRLALRVAALQVWFGNEADHTATCQRMIEAAERASAGDDMDECAAKGWCLRASHDLSMQERVLALTLKGAQAKKEEWKQLGIQQALGMAEFRAGHDRTAEAAFLRVEKLAETNDWNPSQQLLVRGSCRFFRAMILLRDGKSDDARDLFKEAEYQMPSLPESANQVLPIGTDEYQLIYWLAYREAGALLQLQLLKQLRPGYRSAAASQFRVEVAPPDRRRRSCKKNT
jgi:hypothetical protein